MDNDSDRPEIASHDPRTWRRPTPDVGPAPTPSGQGRYSLADRRLLIAAAATGVAAALGLGGSMLMRPRRAPAPTVPHSERRIIEIDSPPDLGPALRSNHVASADVVAAVSVEPGLGDKGRLRVEMDLGPFDRGERALLSMRAEHEDGSGVLLKRAAGGWRVQPLPATARPSVKAIRGEMDEQSFYTSAVGAGIDDRLIPELVRVLAFDFDFVREIKPGDVFECVFEQAVNRFGQPTGPGTLFYMSMVTSAKASAYYRWRRPGGGDSAWFGANGRSVVRALMRTPVDGARVTSTFGLRLHPVLGFVRAHKGVDFGAQVGTPVYASGDGVIGAVGPHGGHGNYIRIDHNPTLSTAYAHLSAFAATTRPGAAVHQGQIIGLSGNTGLSDGPHLHYEVIVNGEQVDPLTYRTGAGESLSGADLAGFLKERLRIDRLRRA